MIPTILVVEDNALNLELVRDVLITAGMKVVEARTALEGLQAASELRPALILLDIRLLTPYGLLLGHGIRGVGRNGPICLA